MSQLTLRLPETLHQKLINLAEKEGVSLNQYITRPGCIIHIGRIRAGLARNLVIKTLIFNQNPPNLFVEERASLCR